MGKWNVSTTVFIRESSLFINTQSLKWHGSWRAELLDFSGGINYVCPLMLCSALITALFHGKIKKFLLQRFPYTEKSKCSHGRSKVAAPPTAGCAPKPRFSKLCPHCYRSGLPKCERIFHKSLVSLLKVFSLGY